MHLAGIKRDLHDRLILVIHAPDGLHILLHAGDFGWSESDTSEGVGCVQV